MPIGLVVLVSRTESIFAGGQDTEWYRKITSTELTKRAFILYSSYRHDLTIRFWAAIILTAATIAAGPTDSPAQGVPTLSRDAYASILTILPGEPLYSAFGHTAIRIRDDSSRIDVVYNFGTFDFDTDWFYLKFARGLLDYRLARNRFGDVLQAYTREERPIIEQHLSLSAQQLQTIVLRLEQNYLPENRFYRYDFFFDNCSTRPRDVVEGVVGDRLLDDTPGSESFRGLVNTYINDRGWTEFGINVLFGAVTDRPATARERMFLPNELMYSLDDARIGANPAVTATDTLFWPRTYQTTSLNYLISPAFILTLLLMLGTLLAFSNVAEHRVGRIADVVLFGLTGLAGLVLLLMWFGTEHSVTKQNWNLLWALPTNLVLAYRLSRPLDNPGRILLWIAVAGCGIVFVMWLAGIQSFHTAVAPLVLLIAVRAGFRLRTAGGERSTAQVALTLLMSARD